MERNKSDGFVGLSRKHLSLRIAFELHSRLLLFAVRYIWEKQIIHHDVCESLSRRGVKIPSHLHLKFSIIVFIAI